jgi:hypothetical protein
MMNCQGGIYFAVTVGTIVSTSVSVTSVRVVTACTLSRVFYDRPRRSSGRWSTLRIPNNLRCFQN